MRPERGIAGYLTNRALRTFTEIYWGKGIFLKLKKKERDKKDLSEENDLGNALSLGQQSGLGDGTTAGEEAFGGPKLKLHVVTTSCKKLVAGSNREKKH